MKYKKSIFLFRRSLRLNDNTGLIEALSNSDVVIPIFIFTHTQLTNNKFKSNNCVQFMIESLDDLNDDLNRYNSRMFYFYGEQQDVIHDLIKNENIEALYCNKDYTRYAQIRDEKIKKVCDDLKIPFHTYDDYLLLPLGSIKSSSNEIYQKFTPYYNAARKKEVPRPVQNRRNNYLNKRNKLKKEYIKDIHGFYKNNPNILVHGGRIEASKIFRNILNFKTYNKDRDQPSIPTTHLSAYNKFGCVSIREVYHIFKKNLGTRNDLIKQLYWRDFYYNLSAYNPHIYLGKSLKDSYDKIKWYGNNADFNKWKIGETGFPFVDAGMRQLNTTGFMHNRSRLITSNFLIKVLLIDWRKGEHYFATQLVDYDPSQNNGNWQWGSGSGADSQPYFRVFNPWLQIKSHDPDCDYIKKWIPELKNVPVKDIINWHETCKEWIKKGIKYPGPIVDYEKQKEKALKMYGSAFR